MTLAVFTTIYPGVESYLADWGSTLRQQTDCDFELWIALDSLDKRSVQQFLGCDMKANWVLAPHGSTPAEIRQQALEQIVQSCSEVVLVDSDDILHPSRVQAARAALQENDLVGCALRLVDRERKNLDEFFGLPSALTVDDVFPRNNIFGFSNSAFRCDLLQRCLPIPASAILVDWFLATRAWLLGAKSSFDRAPRMDYRQHPANTAWVRLPFCCERIVSDTALVRQHYRLLLAAPAENYLEDRHARVKELARDVEEFHQRVVLNPARLNEYVRDLNSLNPPLLWWTCVAYPVLKYLWRE
jgi:hypothetical protein